MLKANTNSEIKICKNQFSELTDFILNNFESKDVMVNIIPNEIFENLKNFNNAFDESKINILLKIIKKLKAGNADKRQTQQDSSNMFDNKGIHLEVKEDKELYSKNKKKPKKIIKKIQKLLKKDSPSSSSSSSSSSDSEIILKPSKRQKEEDKDNNISNQYNNKKDDRIRNLQHDLNYIHDQKHKPKQENFGSSKLNTDKSNISNLNTNNYVTNNNNKNDNIFNKRKSLDLNSELQELAFNSNNNLNNVPYNNINNYKLINKKRKNSKEFEEPITLNKAKAINGTISLQKNKKKKVHFKLLRNILNGIYLLK